MNVLWNESFRESQPSSSTIVNYEVELEHESEDELIEKELAGFVDNYQVRNTVKATNKHYQKFKESLKFENNIILLLTRCYYLRTALLSYLDLAVFISQLKYYDKSVVS